MRIKRLHASFGNLQNEQLHLTGGLNIIEAPNETGKSTWCAFIRAMLYGINTAERDRAGFLSAKTRYRPWSGSAMEGVMDIRISGDNVTLQRTPLGQAPMKNFTAVYAGTETPYPSLSGENAGEVLTGVSEQIFDRTAFIRRAALPVDQSSELEKRISAIVSSGDERSSYTEASDQLRQWQRRLKYQNRSGTIVELEKQLAAAKDRLLKLERENEALSELREEIARLESRNADLKSDLEAFDKLEESSRHNRVVDARETLRKHEKKLAELQNELKEAGGEIPPDKLADFKAAAASHKSMGDVFSNSKAAVSDAKREVELLEAEKSESFFASRKGEEVLEAVSRLSQLAQIKNSAVKDPRKTFLAIILFVLSAAIAASGWIMGLGTVSAALFSALGAALLVLAVILITRPDKATLAGRELDAALKEAGVESFEEFSKKADGFLAICERLNGAKLSFEAAVQGYRSTEKTVQESAALLMGEFQSYRPGMESVTEMEQEIRRTEELMSRIVSGEIQVRMAQNIYSTIAEEYGENPPETPDHSYIRRPLRDKKDTLAAIADTTRRLEALLTSYNLAQGGLRALGDPILLGTEIAGLEEKIALQTEQYSAITEAIETLEDANAEMQRRFSPIISSTAGRYMEKMTGGRYDTLIFSKDFDASARPSGEAVRRDVLSLSTGTADQVYLALRLALCRLILSGDEPCPIVLDDALSNFDDRRLKAALELLLELAEERQILLFTCHDREARCLEGTGGVNIIKI